MQPSLTRLSLINGNRGVQKLERREIDDDNNSEFQVGTTLFDDDEEY